MNMKLLLFVFMLNYANLLLAVQHHIELSDTRVVYIFSRQESEEVYFPKCGTIYLICLYLEVRPAYH